MAYDRGQWRYKGTGGFDLENRFNEPKSNSENVSSLIKCPICGKEQLSTRITCISCNYNLKKPNVDFERFLLKLKEKEWEIPKKKLQDFFNKNYYRAPYIVSNESLISQKGYDLIKSKSNDNLILFVSNEDGNINQIHEKLKDTEHRILSQFSDYSNDFDNLIESINKFEMINKSLSKYSIKSFKNINSANSIPNLKNLSYSVEYISQNDAILLNEFIKRYWKLYDENKISNKSNIDNSDLNEEIKNQTIKLINLKKSVIWFDNNFDKLTNIYDNLGLSYDNIHDKIDLLDEIQILENHPILIDFDEKEEFVNSLSNYQESNIDKISVGDFIKNFKENNNVLLDIVNNFRQYCKTNEIHKEINENISELKFLLKSVGIDCNSLDFYFNLKNNLFQYSNYIYFDKSEYTRLNKKLKDFKLRYDSFNECIRQNKNLLLINLSKKSKQLDYEIKNFQNILTNIQKIKNSLFLLGINLNSFNDFQIHENKLKLLYDHPKLVSNKDYSQKIEILNDFNLKVASKYTIAGFINKNFQDLKKIIFEIFSKLNKEFHKDFELEFMEYNITIVKFLKKKMGIDVGSIYELYDSFSKIKMLSDDTVYSFNDIGELKFSDEFNKLIDDGLYTDETILYLENNSQIKIAEDIHILDISIKSLIYEFENNKDLIYLDDLNQHFEHKSTNSDLNILKTKLSKLIELDNIKDKMLNFPDIFTLCHNIIDVINLIEYERRLIELEKNFEYIYGIFNQFDLNSDSQIIFDTQYYLSKFQENQIINSNFTKLYEEGLFDENILNVSNNTIDKNLNCLFESFKLINEDLIKNNLSELSFDEICSKLEGAIQERVEKKNYINDFSLKIQNFSPNTFENLYCESKNELNLYLDENIKEFDSVCEIISLIKMLKIPNGKQIINWDSSNFTKFLNYLDWCEKYTNYVNKGVIDKKLFNNFYTNIKRIDLKINSIKKQFFSLNIDNTGLNIFSLFNLEKVENIQSDLDKIDKLSSLEFDDDIEWIKNQQDIIEIVYGLCVDYPEESKFDDRSDSVVNYNSLLLKLKNQLKKYENFALLEKDIFSHKNIIEKNLEKQWNGLFSNLDELITKLDDDIEFTKLYYVGIFSDITLKNWKDLSPDDLKFLNDFKNSLSDEKIRSSLMLCYNNRDELFNEINKLDNNEFNNLLELETIFNNLKNILKIHAFDNLINIIDYNIKNESKINELNQYFDVYNKYWGRDDFNISIDDLINQLDIHIKFSDMVNENIINKSYLNLIKKDLSNFLEEVNKFNESRLDVIDKLNLCSKKYSNLSFSNLFNTNTSFKEIKNIKFNFDNPNVYLVNADFLRNNFDEKFASYFDYVICIDNVSLNDKFHLFLLSKNRLSIVKSKGGY